MAQQQALFQLIGNGFLCWSALVGTLSVIVHLRVPWWQSVFGRHLMAYMGTMAAVLDLGVIKLGIGDSPTFQLLRLIVFIGIPVVMTQRLWLQIAAQRGARGSGALPTADRADIPGPPAD